MLTVRSNYSLKKGGILSFEKNSVLFNVYLPLSGYKACFLYEFLVNEYFDGNKNGVIQGILEKTSLLSTEFNANRKILESIGLLETYQKDSSYIFVINPVLNPNDFFDNIVLKGLFVNKVGEERANHIMKFFEVDKFSNKDFKNISANIKDSFDFNFNMDDLNFNNDKILLSGGKNNINDNFKDSDLIEIILRKSNIQLNDITNEDINYVHQLGVLYGFNEKIMAEILIDSYKEENKKGKKIDYSYCKERCKKEASMLKNLKVNKKTEIKISGSTKAAFEINKYEELTPKEFLKQKQNGANVIKSDLNIIQNLYDSFGFTNGIINILLDYTLMRCDQKLNKNFIEKIASTISRKNLLTSLDVYDYLFVDKKKNLVNQNKKEGIVEEESSIDKELESIL